MNGPGPAVLVRPRLFGLDPDVVLFPGRTSERDSSPVRSTANERLPEGAILLTEGVAPVAFQAMREVTELFGITAEARLYQVPDRFSNAQYLCSTSGTSVVVAMRGGMLAEHDRASFLAIMGHELGHHIISSDPARRGRYGGTLEAEISSDRFGVLAARDWAAAVRLELLSATGLPPATLGLSEQAFLDDARAHVESLLERGATMVRRSHPEPAVRAWACRAFWETDLYRQLTGLGPGDRSIAELNHQLAALLPRGSQR